MHTSITIGGTTVHQDEHGRFSLNDLHRAAGGEARHQPALFMRQGNVAELLAEIRSTNPHIEPVLSIRGGALQGTFVCRELVYAYAMWVSAAFNLKVIRAFDAMATGHAPTPPQPALPATYLEALRALVAAEEEKEKLAAETARQQAQLAEQAPKVDAFHRLQDANGTYCLRDAAKVLGLPERDFIARLLREDLLYRTPRGELRAHAEGAKRGRFTHKAGVGRESGHAYTQPRLTPAGLTWLATRWKLEVQQALPLLNPASEAPLLPFGEDIASERGAAQ